MEREDDRPSTSAAYAPTRAVTLAVCAALLLAYALLARSAVRSKSVTYDEPLHAVAGWMHLHASDYRLNPEDPPLWKYWAMLPNGPAALDTSAARDFDTWPNRDTVYDLGIHRILYATPGNAAIADAFIGRGRDMMLIVALALGALIAWWSWRLAGGVAAIIATAFFAFDPNFLAHGPLIKNDVALTLILLGVALIIWRMGQRLTIWNVLALTLLIAAGLTTKFSALLLGPIIALLLVARAMLPRPWICFSRSFTRLIAKLGIALGVCVLCALVSYVAIWAIYGFRFRPSPDPDWLFNMRTRLLYCAITEYNATHNLEKPPKEFLQNWKSGPFPRAVMSLHKHRVLPQAWLDGLLFTYHTTLARKNFLAGNVSLVGWWYYFPVAMLVKSPIALIAATLLASAIGIHAMRRRLARADGWTALCLLLPPLVYLLAAMSSRMNIGLRHVLPIYPFIFIGIGLAGAHLWRRRPRAAQIGGAVVLLALLIESLAAYPDYIPFFNVAAGGERGGLDLLGDSNLDWGQDLKLLARWQQDNSNVRLYLCYFGMADPASYGIKYVNLAGGYLFGPPRVLPSDPGIIAISATHLQGIYQDIPELRDAYSAFRKRKPLQVLGGSIYLYEWSPYGDVASPQAR